MVRNQQLYDEAYERAVQGKSRSVWGIIMSAFEDDYSRRSREEGMRAGMAERAARTGVADPSQDAGVSA